MGPNRLGHGGEDSRILPGSESGDCQISHPDHSPRRNPAIGA
jgi:hypothetical protein